jgi:hypothetical protein
MMMSTILPYQMSEFCVVMSVTVRLYLQLFVGGLMSYLHYLCLIAYSGVHIVLCFLLCLSTSCVPNIVSFSGLSNFLNSPSDLL